MKLNVLALSAILAVAVADTTVTATLSPEGQCATSCKSILVMPSKHVLANLSSLTR